MLYICNMTLSDKVDTFFLIDIAVNNNVNISSELIFFYNSDSLKQCTKCKKFISKSNFHKNKAQKSGLASSCKKCKTKVVSKSMMNRLKTDAFYKFQMTLRSRVAGAFKNHGYKKKSRTHELLGADYEVVKEHIENQFKKGMTWENNTRNGWHIDHIIPLASAKTEEELIKLFHYKNLQPLWAKDNISKGSKVTY